MLPDDQLNSFSRVFMNCRLYVLKSYIDLNIHQMPYLDCTYEVHLHSVVKRHLSRSLSHKLIFALHLLWVLLWQMLKEKLSQRSWPTCRMNVKYCVHVYSYDPILTGFHQVGITNLCKK